MAKRRFKLPGVQDLTKKQDEVLAQALDGQHLVVGGPGTGKSVMALLRAKRANQSDRGHCFLLYNHTLRRFTDQLFDGDMKSAQWQSWFWRTHKKTTGENPAVVETSGGGFAPFDWRGIIQKIEKTNECEEISPLLLIIDEGQDMPPEFYEALPKLSYENIFVVADQNQQIARSENSSRLDIQNALGLDGHEVIELTENFRNNFAVARLARHFYTGDPAVSAPELPPAPKHQLTTPILFSYREDQFLRMLNKIIIMAHNAPSKLIGVICPTIAVVDRYASILTDIDKENNHGVAIGVYKSGSRCDLQFDEGGIMIITAQSCKGLEFDLVFLADIEKHASSGQDEDQLKRIFYVMVSRAIERVYLLKRQGIENIVDDILPRDNSIMERKPMEQKP